MRTALLCRAALPCRPARLHNIAHVYVHVLVCCLCGACSPSCCAARQSLGGWVAEPSMFVQLLPQAGPAKSDWDILRDNFRLGTVLFLCPMLFILGPVFLLLASLPAGLCPGTRQRRGWALRLGTPPLLRPH